MPELAHAGAGLLGFWGLSAPQGPAWEFLVVFVVVAAGPKVVEKAGVPGIVGLLLGGYVIGPHGLGFITAGNDTVPDIGQMGLLYLMFVAGVELDLNLARRHRNQTLVFGVLTFSFPMAAGVAVGLGLAWGTPAALLLGSLLASHTLITYPLVAKQGLAHDPAVATAVAATVLTDTIALVVLAGVAGTETGDGSTLAIALRIAVGLVVLVAFSFLALPWVARRSLRAFGADRAVRYLIAVCGFLSAAVVAEVFGIEGIVGAFAAGLGLNRLVPNEGPLMERLEFFGSAVFIPVFLVSVGLILDPAVMVEGQTLGYAALISVACLGGKLIGSVLGARVLGFTRAEGWLMFSLTTPQAAATLAATIVGFQIGLFSSSVVNAVLILILVSIVVSTLVAGRAVAAVPPAEEGERPLGAHVMVAVGHPDPPAGAFALAGALAGPDGGAVDTILVTTHTDARHDEAALGTLDAIAGRAGVDGTARTRIGRSFADVVVDAAASEAASAVVVVDPDLSPAGRADWAANVGDRAGVPVIAVRDVTGGLAGSARVIADGTAPEPARQLAADVAARLGIKGAGTGRATPPPTSEAATEESGREAVTVIPLSSWDELTAIEPGLAGTLLIFVPPAAHAPPEG